MIDERTEILINRRLDGELTPDESLELDKRLIRDPQARTLLAELRNDDRAVADALNSFANEINERRSPISDELPPRRLPWYFRLAGPMAIAASVAMMFMFLQQPTPTPSPTPDDAVIAADQPVPVETTVAEVSPLRPVAKMTEDGILLADPHLRDVGLQRDILGVMDEQNQQLYLLELERSREKVVPVRMSY